MRLPTRSAKPQQSATHRWHGVLIGFLLLILLASASSVAYARLTEATIMPGVSVLGHHLGGLTQTQAATLLSGLVAQYASDGVTIVGVPTTTTPTLAELGILLDVPKTVENAFAVGRYDFLRPYLALPRRYRIAVPLVVTYSEKTFTRTMDSLAASLTTPVVEPSLRVEDDTVIVVPGMAGRKVVADTTLADAATAVSTLTTLTLQLSVREEQPKLAEADLNEAHAIVETMISGPVTLTADKHSFAVSKEQLQQWVTYSVDPSRITASPKQGIVISMNDDLAGAYLRSLNATVGVPSQSAEGYAAETLGEYAYKNFQGKEVDVAATLDRLQAAAQEPDLANRTAAIVIGPSDPRVTILPTPPSPKPTGKVIAVNVTTQQLFAYEDGALKFWTHVSTGTRGYETPTGEWKIYNKTPIQWMIGQGYALPNVKWVMPYNGDYTLHTAYWHTDFGKPKSHGCTNMSERDAKWLYDWAEIGTPVVIYAS